MLCAPNAVTNPAAYNGSNCPRALMRTEAVGSGVVTGSPIRQCRRRSPAAVLRVGYQLRSPPVCMMAPSHLVQRGEHPLGVVGQPLGAALELLARLGGRGRAEHITGRQVAVPAAQPLQAVFLFFEFGHGELGDPDLLVDLGVEFGAVGDELGPLFFSLRGEQGLQPGSAVHARPPPDAATGPQAPAPPTPTTAPTRPSHRLMYQRLQYVWSRHRP